MQSTRPHPTLFYFGEEDDEVLKSSVDAVKKRPSLPTANSLHSVSSESPSINNVLLFPIENSHAYSYAHLSPNSLALRLNVLKRSLEILNDRPDWFKTINSHEEGLKNARNEVRNEVRNDMRFESITESRNSDDEDFKSPTKPLLPASVEGARRKSSHRLLLARSLLRNESNDHLSTDKFKMLLNASSAALTALFRPKINRADSLPMSRTSFEDIGEANEESVGESDTVLNDDLKDIIELLEQDSSIISHNSDIALTLHDLSLSSNDEISRKKQNLLKTKMLYALATPFVETTAMATSPWAVPPTAAPSPGASLSPLVNASTTALNLLNSIQQPQAATATGNRPFHAISSGKHTSPQSVVTVEADYPWNFKAANDLACLMFGVLKSMIRNLTLLDLIAPQFRNFLTDRLTRVSDESRRKTNNDIIFAGEIIAISRQAEGGFAWTSIWAKRRKGLIICMFEQIACDAFDVMVLRDVATYPDSKYVITNVDEIAGKLITKLDASGITQVNVLSESLAADLHSDSSLNESSDIRESEAINAKRYYTVQLNSDDNIPCALTSYPLEKDDEKFELKIKIHSMPYIAGMFVVDFNDYKVLSCNKAIAKNLFGRSSDVIVNNTINNIIPGFSDILKLGLDDPDTATAIVPGLVLPEHFFRKYHAYYKHRIHNNVSPDDLFVNSRGIEGLHRDGKSLFIDVQLRVILTDVFVLWVTYSRHTNKNITRQLKKLSSASSVNLKGSGGLLTKTRSNPGLSSSKVDLPSQLKLFPKNESELLELGSASPEMSRQSSLRKPKKANTFAVPVTYITDPTFTNNEFTKSLVGSPLSKTEKQKENSLTLDIPKKSEQEQRKVSDAGVKHYENFSEEEMLAIENELLAKQQKESKFWPTTIGARKRTKKYDEFKVLKKMGEGAYGKVVLGEHKDDPAYKVIIKCIDKQRILVDTWVRDRQLGTIPSEIQVMATLNHEPHPNIMRIIDYFEDPNYYYLETPIFGNPPAIDLFDYIEVKKDMNELDCQLIFKQVVLAIYHLHKHGIVHRDIKDENIIVNEFGVIKLIDFGSAGYVKLGPFDVFVGTIDYASPEVLRGEKYEGKPQDIWALGILLYTMIYKENPFYNVDEIMEGDMRVPFVVSKESLDLVKLILNREVADRPTITDIADHDWLDI